MAMHIPVHSFGFYATLLHVHYGFLSRQIPQSTIPIILLRLVVMARPDRLLHRLRLQVRCSDTRSQQPSILTYYCIQCEMGRSLRHLSSRRIHYRGSVGEIRRLEDVCRTCHRLMSPPVDVILTSFVLPSVTKSGIGLPELHV